MPKLGVLEIFWPGYRAESDERMLSPKIVEKGEHHAVLRFPDGDLPDVKITLQNDIIRLEYGSGRTGTLHIRLTFPQRPGRNFSWRVPGKQMDFRPLPAVLQEKHHIWRGRASGFEFAEEDIRGTGRSFSLTSFGRFRKKENVTVWKFTFRLPSRRCFVREKGPSAIVSANR